MIGRERAGTGPWSVAVNVDERQGLQACFLPATVCRERETLSQPFMSCVRRRMPGNGAGINASEPTVPLDTGHSRIARLERLVRLFNGAQSREHGSYRPLSPRSCVCVSCGAPQPATGRATHHLQIGDARTKLFQYLIFLRHLFAYPVEHDR